MRAVTAAALAVALAPAVARATADCGPCADAARSAVEYRVTLGAAALDVVARAVAGDEAAARGAFVARCTLDTTRATPRVTCATPSADTLARWRAAVERWGRSAADSSGAAGIAALAAIDRASARPDQPLTAHRGPLVRDARGVHLAGCDPPVEVTGPGADSLASPQGADVWMQGRCRGPGRFEWAGGRVMGRPRVDLFVMGYCPYARRLEKQMSADLAKLPPGKAPEIAVHYLLYRDDDGPVPRIGSTHGERERIEDAVQIRIRDDHPTAFWRYLALRADSESPWEVLAQRAGLGWTAIAAIQRRVARDTDAMLEAEHAYNVANFPRITGSPTIFWRGGIAQSITEVAGFTAPPNEHEQCAEGAGEAK